MIALVVITLILLAAFAVVMARTLNRLRSRPAPHPLAESSERLWEI